MTFIDNFHWRCFLALEEELISTQNFVEFHKENYKTFSIKYRSIILQACSEIEKIFRHLCNINPTHKSDINEFIQHIKTNYEGFFNIVVSIPLYNEEKSPEFWKACNRIKHQGNLDSATLENAINSLAGLFSLLLAWYVKSNGEKFSACESFKLPNLFSYKGLGPNLLTLANSNKIDLPGFKAVIEIN